VAALIIALILFVLTIVCYIQIITKAGYSPWWILLPLSLPVLWLIATADAFHGFSSGLGTFGVFDPQGIADQEKALGWLILLDIIANYVMLVAFAFSDWPVIQAARSRFPAAGDTGGRSAPRLPQRPSGPAPAPGPISGPMGDPSAPSPQGQPAGWYKSGPVGAGEQSYWDGSVWTAKRQWSGGDWVDLPLAQPQPVGSEGTPAPPD
jgi:hypothetical protein